MYIYIEAFFFLAMLPDLRGNEKAEMKEVPLSCQPSFLETQRSEIKFSRVSSAKIRNMYLLSALAPTRPFLAKL